MALAIVRHEGSTSDALRFFADLGTNRYYAFAIGKAPELDAEHPEASGATFRSELFGPIPETTHGKVRFSVPSSRFDGEHRYLQLCSFRSPDRVGPAVSEPLIVPLGSSGNGDMLMQSYTSSQTAARPFNGYSAAFTKAPVGSFGAGSSTRALTHADNRTSRYRRAPLASAMFFGALASLLPSILPGLGQVLGGLFGNRAGNGGAGGSANPDLQRIIGILSQLLSGTQTATSGPAPASPAATVRQESTRSVSRLQLRALSHPDYARAHVAPAALIPMLAPLLQQVLTPETIRSLIESVSPTQITGTLINGVKEIANLGIQSNQQDLEHLRKLNPGVDDAALDGLLKELSLAKHVGEGDLQFRRVQRVSLEFMDAPSHDFGGRQRVVYRQGRPLEFSLRLSTPRKIGSAGLQIAIKDPTSLRLLARQRVQLDGVEGGALEPVRFEPAMLRRLQPNQEYLVVASLIWKNKRRETLGTSKTQLITLMGGALVDRLGERKALLALEDNQRMAAFWHKAYESEFSRERARVTLRCRYIYAIDAELDVNARNPSRVRLGENANRRLQGRLATGMDLSLKSLNALLPIAFDSRALNEEELEALHDVQFLARQHRAADCRMELYASPGNSAAMWVYPELGLHDLVLRVPEKVDECGAVRSFTERVVSFPLPAAAFFATVSTDSSGQETQGAFAGKRVIDKRRVALTPIELVRRGGDTQPSDGSHHDG